MIHPLLNLGYIILILNPIIIPHLSQFIPMKVVDRPHHAHTILITDYWLLITEYWLLITDYWLLITYYWLLITDYWLQITD